MSDLALRAGSGDLAAVEEIRRLMSDEPGPPPRFDGGPPDRRRRPQGASVVEASGLSADDLTIKVISSWLRTNGAATPVSPGPALVFAPQVDVAARKARGGGLRLPWRHRGRRHPGLG